MNYHLKEILLHEGFERYDVSDSPAGKPKKLSGLSKVNIFVGANNCGKSRFLRLLAATASLAFVPKSGTPLEFFTAMRSSLDSDFDQIFKRYNLDEADDIRATLNKIPKFEYMQEGGNHPSLMLGVLQAMSTKNRIVSFSFRNNAQPGFNVAPPFLGDLQKTASQLAGTLAEAVKGLEPKYAFAKTYIPTLRGLRDFPGIMIKGEEAKDIYSRRTLSDYFPNFKPEIWTGLTLYDEIKRLLLGDWSDRQRVGEFEQFLADTFFEGQQVELIPKYNDTVLNIKLGKEHQFPIQQLGDGIQSLIVLTFPLFKHKGEKLLFFCEEPELNMHPGMQRAFLKLVTGPTFPEYQYFFTTHSNHFLDLTIDFKEVSVYTFEKEIESTDAPERDAKFRVTNVSSEDRRPLELLGVRNSSVFLSNCTIWVEGVTDRRYFKKYLQLYQDSHPEKRRFAEDLHYSFVEFGGACITHWSFLDSNDDAINVQRLCGKLFLITDRDTATKWKEGRREKLKHRLEERYYCLESNEVENLLSEKVLLDVLRGYGERDFQDLKASEYQAMPLGEFIEQHVLKDKPKRKGGYAENGTVRAKVDFCDKATAAMKTVDDLSKEAQEIAARLYDFILKNNT